jgi:hypothetical protein
VRILNDGHKFLWIFIVPGFSKVSPSPLNLLELDSFGTLQHGRLTSIKNRFECSGRMTLFDVHEFSYRETF